MTTPDKHVTRWIFMGLSSLLLVLSLVACGGTGGSGNAATPTTAAAATPTAPVATKTSVTLLTYTGTGYSISYPSDWKKETQQTAVIFTDTQQNNTVTVVVAPNPGGTVSASKVVASSLAGAEASSKATNVKPVSNLAPTVTLAGQTWVESGVTGTVVDNGLQVDIEMIALGVNYPANSPTTQTYELYYAGPVITFQQENVLIFQPMLQSFKFAA